MLGTSLIMEMVGVAADATVVGSLVGVATNAAGLFVAASGTAVALTDVTISAADSFGDWISHFDSGGSGSGWTVTSKPTAADIEGVKRLGNLMDTSDAICKLTGFGRAFAKHSGRPGNTCPNATGGPENINKQGASEAEKILSDPNVVEIDRGPVMDYSLSNGKGLRIDNVLRMFKQFND